MVDHRFFAKDPVSLAIQCAALDLGSRALGFVDFFIEKRTASPREDVAGDCPDINCSLAPGDDLRSLEDVPANKS